jgi:hypothetical protein
MSATTHEVALIVLGSGAAPSGTANADVARPSPPMTGNAGSCVGTGDGTGTAGLDTAAMGQSTTGVAAVATEAVVLVVAAIGTAGPASTADASSAIRL